MQNGNESEGGSSPHDIGSVLSLGACTLPPRDADIAAFPTEQKPAATTSRAHTAPGDCKRESRTDTLPT